MKPTFSRDNAGGQPGEVGKTNGNDKPNSITTDPLQGGHDIAKLAKKAAPKIHTAMSNVANLLSRLDKVKPTGNGTYLSRCPAHEDRSPSLAIRETDEGVILLYCFAGCHVHDVVGAVGLDISDLFPPRAIHHGKPERRPFPAADVLRAIEFEALVVAAAAVSMRSGEPLSTVDQERLMLAVSRIHAAVTAGGLNHG